MDREIYFVHQHRCYVVRWIADPSEESSREHWKALTEHPEFEPGHAALHDFRGRNPRGGYEEAQEGRDTYVRDVAPHVGDGRVAMLVDSPMAYGQARMIAIMLALEETSLVTYSEEDAKEWVGLSADYEFPYPTPSSGSSESGSSS